MEARRDAEEGEEIKPIRRGWCLGEETTMTVGWIAERLGMGTRGHLNHLPYRGRKSEGE